MSARKKPRAPPALSTGEQKLVRLLKMGYVTRRRKLDEVADRRREG